MMCAKILQKIKSFTVAQLVFMPLLTGFLLIFVWVAVRGSFEGTTIEIIVFNIILIVFGCSGIPIIICKELPGPWRTKGVAAVVDGVLILLAAWLIPILSLLRFIADLFV